MVTKKEFDKIFETTYADAVKEFSNPSNFKATMSHYLDDHDEISSKDLAAFVFAESMRLNKKIMKSILEAVLEFDE